MGLPLKLQKFFWDVDITNIDIQRHSNYIVERLLEYGNDEAVKWAVRFYGQEKISEVVRKSRKISPKTANFWRLLLNLNPQDVLCLSESYQKRQNKFWRY